MDFVQIDYSLDDRVAENRILPLAAEIKTGVLTALPFGRARLFRAVRGNLMTARRVLDSVRDGSIDVGPLDAYWHTLIRRHAPDLAAGVRVLESTATAPMPAFVAAPALPAAQAAALRHAFADAAARPWFAPLAEALLIEGFAPVDLTDFAPTLAWDAAAMQAGYPEPA